MTHFNYNDTYTAINTRNSNDAHDVKLVGYKTGRGYTFVTVDTNETFTCKYVTSCVYTDNIQAVDVSRGGTHYMVNTKTAH